jgi:uncharacterized protein
MVGHNKKIAARYLFWLIHCVKIILQIPTGCCRFSPTCSEYAKEAVEKLPLLVAGIAIIKRFFRCHPFNDGGYDPLPEKHISAKG